MPVHPQSGLVLLNRSVFWHGFQENGATMKNMIMTEPVKQAVLWISEEMRDAPEKNLTCLLDAAASRFNLGPQDWEFLRRFFETTNFAEHETP